MPRYIDAEKIRPYKGFFEKVDNVPKFYEWVETLPTADVVERKVGKWIEPTRDGCITYDKRAYAECSVCGGKSYLGWSMFYCPNCGARMGERSEDGIQN